MERRTRMRWGIAIGVVLGVFALGFLADQVTSSPQLCGACHEMRPRVATWKQSAHASVDCVKCHVAPHKWYEVPQAIIGRSALLGRDISLHVAGGYQDPVETRREHIEPVKDETCLQCHDPNRKATSGFRILIDHPEHAKRNKSCVSCHVRTAHPVETRGKALTLMGQCFTCHGVEKTAKAPATCTLCHPSDFELLPASHAPDAKWKRDHGSVALKDRKQCEMCHEKQFCTNCHGVEMPHPENWSKRGSTSHSSVAEENRQVCNQCHGSRPDMCTMCHHKAYEPTKGTWVKQHFLEVEKRGTAYCMKCHAPVFCVRCHVAVAMGTAPEDQ
ncbi:MAG TPA: NapC/NirT family cytochrome c [Coriobacteriia bacterium]|nr:NapC/NirT family cytochrome c [Coriobacteriia bacterium]